jgi:hypothetical protein
MGILLFIRLHLAALWLQLRLQTYPPHYPQTQRFSIHQAYGLLLLALRKLNIWLLLAVLVLAEVRQGAEAEALVVLELQQA